MGLQFERITYAPQFSLTQIVEDTAVLRHQGLTARASVPGLDLEAWLNAVQRQNTPLIQSKSRRADLEAWLEAANLATGTDAE